MSSHDILSLQHKMMASWGGHPVDPRGLLRVFNEGGSRPPLLWIFNTPNEPECLARAVGPDQPLMFARSTHLLVRPEDDPAHVRAPLARYLVAEIKQHFGDAHFDIGASCQGTGLALDLCSGLQTAGNGVGHLCLINCALNAAAADRPALLIYGDEDQGQDPFEADFQDAERRANALFPTYERHVVRAQHGAYYHEGILDRILAEFDAFQERDRAVSSSASSSAVG